MQFFFFSARRDFLSFACQAEKFQQQKKNCMGFIVIHIYFCHDITDEVLKPERVFESCSECVKTVNEAKESKDQISSYTHTAENPGTVFQNCIMTFTWGC